MLDRGFVINLLRSFVEACAFAAFMATAAGLCHVFAAQWAVQ